MLINLQQASTITLVSTEFDYFIKITANGADRPIYANTIGKNQIFTKYGVKMIAPGDEAWPELIGFIKKDIDFKYSFIRNMVSQGHYWLEVNGNYNIQDLRCYESV